MADKNFRIYPQGLYDAIAEVSMLNVPIYITGNGVPDKEDLVREIFLRRSLYALSEAIKDGYDVRGYFYWSLMDSFEWNEGYEAKFGLFEVDFLTQERKLRSGAKAYSDLIEKWRLSTANRER